MTKDEVSKFLILAMGIDNRLNPADQNAFIAKVEGWHLALSNSMTFEFAREALGKHYANQTDAIMPANLNTIWKVERDRQTDIKAAITDKSEAVPMPDNVRALIQGLKVNKQ
jgi:hypothetical protein